MEITLNGTTYTIDGDDAEALQQAITQLEIDSSGYLAENQGLKTKVSELQTQLELKTDSESVDFDSLVGERLQIWSEVLPHLRHDDEDFEPNYNLSPLQVKVTYLNSLKVDADWKNELVQRKDDLMSDNPSATTIAFVNGLYSVLKTSGSVYKPVSHTDQVLESIMWGKHQGSTNTSKQDGRSGKVTKIDHRKKLQEAIEAKNPSRNKSRKVAG